MFDPKIYAGRRERLKKQVGSGLMLFLGNVESPMNYPANPYHFRQDSSFLYFFGLDSSGLAGVVDADDGRDLLFGNDVDVEDIIWMGDQPTLRERAQDVGIQDTAPLDKLAETIRGTVSKGKRIHYLPPYCAETILEIERLLGIKADRVKEYVSEELIKAVVEQRACKITQEVAEIEAALQASFDMHTTAMKMAKPGVYEREIAGVIEGIALSYGAAVAFPVILTVNGQILHNHYHGNRLEAGNLLVNDSGAESRMHYASDITRTIPVGGKFSQKQKEIYELVFQAQLAAIQAIKPGVKNKDVHNQAVTVIASGLKDVGLLKGDVQEAVKAGAHALFMPHGMGHMLGLDVHDMEGLGENYVGYDKTVKRSDQFGLAYLRLARELQPGFVITVEPGIYFIPVLIDKWIKEGKHTQFIDYEQVNSYRDFGGIRLEDNILVTEEDHRVLGKPIPKTIAELEEITGSG
jgi:Xaa-Pro aminopeptidase